MAEIAAILPKVFRMKLSLLRMNRPYANSQNLFLIQVPVNLTAEQKELIREYAETEKDTPGTVNGVDPTRDIKKRREEKKRQEREREELEERRSKQRSEAAEEEAKAKQEKEAAAQEEEKIKKQYTAEATRLVF